MGTTWTGQGVLGVTLPGCAETYSSFEESEQEESERGGGGQRRQRFRDQHQKIHHFWKGDVLALPAGVAHWVYNKASSSKDEKLVILVVHDISNRDNQLDQNLRVGNKFNTQNLLNHYVFRYFERFHNHEKF